MKNTIMSLFILLVLSSCSAKKAGTKSEFKLVLGMSAVSVPISGGAYVETQDVATNIKGLIKLDETNSATIPFGTYNLMFVAFEGPLPHTGKMYCSMISNTALLNPTAIIEVKLTQTACLQNEFTQLISKILGNTVSTWGTAKFGVGKWGQ